MPKHEELIDLAGSLSGAIDELMEFGRGIWHLGFSQKKAARRGGVHLFFPSHEFEGWRREFISAAQGQKRQLRGGIFDHFASLGEIPSSKWLRTDKDSGTIELRLEIFMPRKLVEAGLGGGKLGRDSDREYFMWRNIRRKYEYGRSPETVHVFNILCNTINLRFRNLLSPEDVEDLDEGVLAERNSSGRAAKRFVDYQDDLSTPLLRVLERDAVLRPNAEHHRCVFLECCRMVGYVSPDYGLGGVRIQAEKLDAEFLLSKLFGLPTEMLGFDHLFGGGGIAFADNSGLNKLPAPAGRIVLIRGRSGSGKSSLALALAAEVARKEGLAWVMPFEQSATDCRDYLESMNALSHGEGARTVQEVGALTRILEEPLDAKDHRDSSEKHQGVIVLLQTQQDNLDTIFDRLVEKAEATRLYPLRLLVVDAINSILGWGSAEAPVLRSKLMRRIERIKRSGANLLMVAEDDEHPQNPVRFVENLADTVIDLSRDREHGYSQRYIEVTKSRLQRDQRGKHPFSIKAGRGVTVALSSAAVLARIQNRRFKGIEGSNKFGWDALDEVLGPGAVFRTDVLVLRGGEGAFKTHIGLLFALGSDSGAKPGSKGAPRSLVVPIRDNPATIRALLDSRFIRSHRSRHQNCKGDNQIAVVEVPRGFVQPGAVFHILEQEFERAQAAGEMIDRVMIDNLSHWEMSSPFIREDETFGDTLTEFLRRQHVSTLFVCGNKPGHSQSVVQSSVIDDANTLIDFHRIDFRGAQRVILRVVKTRGMRHKPESFDVILGDDGLQLGPASKLLRVGTSGEVTAVDTQLYLHEENLNQRAYNANIIDSLKPVLSRKVALNSKDRTHLVRAIQLSPYSTVDELQILQLDEFQLPELASPFSKSLLHVFPKSDWKANRWDDLDPRLTDRVRRENGSFFAVPYYDNLGLLAFSRNLSNEDVQVSEEDVQDWTRLANCCAKWERSDNARKNPQDVFFFFRTNIDENYNCLFFEILLSLGSVPPPLEFIGRKPDDTCRIKQWFNDPMVPKACSIVRTLCRRVHLLTYSEQTQTAENLGPEEQGRITTTERRRDQICERARVWRHWFTSLSQMLDDMPHERRDQIEVRPLPGNKAVAGEWYLGVPAYSAAPDVGLEIIRILTTRDEELERLRRGVGLPTRHSFYKSTTESNLQSRYVTLSATLVGQLLKDSFRRSCFDCYPKVSRIISFHLKKIIEFEVSKEANIESASGQSAIEIAIRKELQSLRQSISFALDQHPCGRCQQ